nr:MAG TPA: hypothetical protein [Caudoviricetes sp.]
MVLLNGFFPNLFTRLCCNQLLPTLFTIYLKLGCVVWQKLLYLQTASADALGPQSASVVQASLLRFWFRNIMP